MTDPVTIVSLLAIAAGLLGVIANNRLSDWRNKRAIIRQAVHSYKLAFKPEIASLNSNDRVSNITDDIFDRHRNAVNDIMPILPVSYQRKLQKAWNNYHHHGYVCDTGATEKEVINTVWELVYMGIDAEPDESGVIKPFKKLHSCLDDLL